MLDPELKQLLGEVKTYVQGFEKRLQKVETATRSRRWATEAVQGVENEKEKFSFQKAINAMVTGDWEKAGFEAEVFRNTKAMSAGDDSAGGYLVPAQVLPGFIEMLRAESVVLASGATLIDGLQGAPILIPKQTGGATVYWPGENVAITPSDLATGQLSLQPKKAAALVQVSNRLIRQSNPAVEAMIRQSIALDVALDIDLKVLRGEGGINEPLGIANTPGILTIGDGTASPTFDSFYDMRKTLAMKNALRGKLGFIFSPEVTNLMAKLKVAQFTEDTGGQYIASPLTDAQMSRFIGYPFRETTQIPIDLGTGHETEIYFANWAECIIAQWAGFEIMASQQAGTAFAADQTWVRIITELDAGLRHPESFCLGSYKVA
jgi:HK97 family phage major capsid protein